MIFTLLMNFKGFGEENKLKSLIQMLIVLKFDLLFNAMTQWYIKLQMEIHFKESFGKFVRLSFEGLMQSHCRRPGFKSANSWKLYVAQHLTDSAIMSLKPMQLCHYTVSWERDRKPSKSIYGTFTRWSGMLQRFFNHHRRKSYQVGTII